MKYWVAVTDNDWFEFLQKRNPDEVNFWQPRPRPPFTSLPEGTPFLFKLKSPNNHIAGGGYFLKYSALPLSLAWESFGEKNGCSSLEQLRSTINRHIPPTTRVRDADIGCVLLTRPYFFPREDWISLGSYDWSGNIVRGKTFDTHDAAGAALWTQVAARIAKMERLLNIADVEPPAYGSEYLARARLGQGAFRVLVTEAYQRRCAITGENILPVLEAAHIMPFSASGPSRTNNGMLLRSDFHKLFDRGLITVTPELHVEVSLRIREEWFNGKAYYRLHGQRLTVVPEMQVNRPNPEYLQWHNVNRFDQ